MPIVNYGIDGDLGRRFEDIERRIKELEVVPQTHHTTLTDGTLTIIDDAGRSRVMLGLLPDGNYGLETHDAAGRVMLKVSEVGASRPTFNLPTYADISTWPTTTSASFLTIWQSSFMQLSADAVSVEFAVSAPVGTNAEVRLFWTGGALASAVQSYTGTGSFQSFAWNWRPGWEANIGTFAPIELNLQVRRTAGAGVVDVARPTQILLAPSADIGATATGV